MGFWSDVGDTFGVGEINGALKRVGRIGHAVYQIADNLPVVGPGVWWDIMRAPFVDDPKLNGFWHTIIGRPIARLGDEMNATMGPQGVGGQLIGALPVGVRQAGNYVVQPINEIDNNLYRNVVSEPISTLMTMGSMMDRPGGHYGDIMSGAAWKEAYGIAQHRSPGQAVALAWGTTDIMDDTEVSNFQGTDMYNWISGASDALLRWELDPQVLSMKGLGIVRGKYSLANPQDMGFHDINLDQPEHIANYINNQKLAADRMYKLSEQLAAGEGHTVDSWLARLNGDRIMADIGKLDPNWATKYHSGTLGIDRWRASGLTDEVTAWYKRTQQSYEEMLKGTRRVSQQGVLFQEKGIATPEKFVQMEHATSGDVAEWARNAQIDLNERLTRTEYPKVVIHDAAGLPTFESAKPAPYNPEWPDLRQDTFHKPGDATPILNHENMQMETPTKIAGAPHPNMLYNVKTDAWELKPGMNIPSQVDQGVTIGVKPFDETMFPAKGLTQMNPEKLLQAADFGPGVKQIMGSDIVKFEPVARGYVPAGYETENLAHIKYDPKLVGRDLIDKSWVNASDMTVNGLIGDVASRDSQLALEGVGAPAAKVVDHTIAHKQQLVAVSVGQESDPSIMRATKRINSHADIHPPTVQLMTVKHAEKFKEWARVVLSSAGDLKDQMASLPTDYTGYRQAVQDSMSKLRPPDSVMEQLAHEFPQETWTGSMVQKRKMAQRAFELAQGKASGAIVTVDFNKLMSIDEIQSRPVTAGQLANTDARITSPMVWNENVGKYVRQDYRWELHGDIRVKDPGLIPEGMTRKPSVETYGRTLRTQTKLNQALSSKFGRFGMTMSTPWAKMDATIAGWLHNPDVMMTDEATRGRSFITFSKKEQEVAYESSKLVRSIPLQDQVQPQLIPDKLYHTTGYADQINKTGAIEARIGGGFGLDPYNLQGTPGVSLTSNEAAALVNERWLREVVGPMVQQLGPRPTELQVAEYLTSRVDELMGDGASIGARPIIGGEGRIGEPGLAKSNYLKRQEDIWAQHSDVAHGEVYSPALNTFSHYWQDSHDLLVTPEYFVGATDDVIAQIRPENVKTYQFDGTDVAGAPGALANPHGDSEYRYYGDIPLVGQTAVEHGGYPTYSTDIATGQAAYTEPNIKEAAQLQRESTRIRWEYDHNNPDPITNNKRFEVAGHIRDKFFPNHAQGASISYALAFAKDSNERQLVMRTYLGDFRAYNEIGTNNILLRKMLQDQASSASIVRGRMDLAEELNQVNNLGESMTDYWSGKLDQLHQVIDQTANELQMRNQIMDAFNTVHSVPVTNVLTDARTAITNSALYQMSPWTKPVRIFFQMMPHRSINTFDPTSDVQFQRMMQVGGMHPDEVLEWRGKYMAATPVQREAIVSVVDSAMVQKRMMEHGLDREQINELMRTATKQKQRAASYVQRVQFDANPSNTIVEQASNHLGIRYNVFEDVNDVVYAPIWGETQTTSQIYMTDFRLLDKQLRPIALWKSRYEGLDTAVRIPKELLENVQKVWRGAVLFRPAWPVRVIFDEQLRIMAKLGPMMAITGSAEGFRDLTDHIFRKRGYKIDVPIVGDLADSAVHQMANIPDATAAAQFAAKVDQVNDDYARLELLDTKRKEAANYLQVRSDREKVLRQAMQESHDPTLDAAYGRERHALNQAKMMQDLAQKRYDLAGRKFYKGPGAYGGVKAGSSPLAGGELEAAMEIAQRELDAANELVQFHTQETAAAARAALSGSEQGARMRWAAAKSDMDEATKAARITEEAYNTHQVKVSTRARMTLNAMPDTDQMARDIVNPQIQTTDIPPGTPTRSQVTSRGVRAGAIGGAVTGGVIAGPIGAAVGAGAGALLMDQLAKLESSGFSQFGYNGYRIQGAFGTQGDKKLAMLQAVSSRGDVYEFLDRAARESMAGMEFNPNTWRTVPFDDPAYGATWSRAMQNIQNDTMGEMILKMGKQALEPEGAQKIENWLLDTVEGRQYGARLPQRRGWEHEWVTQAIDQVDRYTSGFDETLLQQLYTSQARSTMQSHISPVLRPAVHGPELESILGKGPTGWFSQKMNDWFHALGTAPTDHLSRMPYFNHVYEAEIKRMLNNITGPRIKESMLRTMEDRAREYALNETKTLLYDLAERSEFAQIARFIMPFFGAWQEVMTRWAGLAIENPLFAVRAKQVWGAPDKVPGMMVTDPSTQQKYIQFRLPEFAKGLINHGPLASALDSQGYIRFQKAGVSMLASGMPGFGPFVNLLVSEVVKDRPDTYSSLKFLLPYGVSDSVIDPFLPSAGRRLTSLARGEDDAAYASAYHAILITRITQIQEHSDPKWVPSDLDNVDVQRQLFAEVKTETNSLFAIRTASAFLSPVALQFKSIYQPLIDHYRELRELNPDTADQVFLEQYGNDMVYLTQAATQTNDGVPPTLHGQEAYTKFGPLISKYPEYGSVIVGADAGGESSKFMSQVYNSQLRTPLSPGSDVMQRKRLSPLETIVLPQVRQGWQEFSREMDKVDAYMIQYGLKTYAQAPDIRDYKNRVVSYLAKKYPEWGNEYFQRDERKWEKRIEAFTAMTQEPGLKDRPDMQGVALYLIDRQQVMDELNKRNVAGGSADIFAQSNSDLFEWWSADRLYLKEKNLQFADLYNRYLDRDPLTIDPILGSSE